MSQTSSPVASIMIVVRRINFISILIRLRCVESGFFFANAGYGENFFQKHHILACSIETEIKVIIVGNGMIGKTTLMDRFVTGRFSSEYRKTLGVDFIEKRQFVPAIHEEVTFFLYDTAGQEEYGRMTRGFYKGSGAAIVAYSSVDRESFLAVKEWVKIVREECGRIPIILVQTKGDLEAVIDPDDSLSLSYDIDAKLFRVSSKTNTSVDEVFEQICVEYTRRKRLLGGQLENPVRTICQTPAKKPPSPVRVRPPEKKTKIYSSCTIS
jgi:Ras-related protein Rab-23